MIKDSENDVHVENYGTLAHVTTKENGIGRSVVLEKEEMLQVADMLYAVAEKMDE